MNIIKSMTTLMLIIFSTSLFAGELKIHFKNIKGNKGQIALAIFNSSVGFPDDNSKAFLRLFISLTDAADLKIDLPEGKYAIALFQDINSNQKLDTNAIGIPKEPFGFSNNPKLLFGPPSFSKAQFKMTNENHEINLVLKEY